LNAWKERFLNHAKARHVDDLEGSYEVRTSTGRLLRMKVRFYRQDGAIWCEHQVLGFVVARTIAETRKETLAGDTGINFHLYSARRYMRRFWTDELRMLENGDLVGRVVLFPNSRRFAVKYFIYGRTNAQA